ncbi:hypothetical protein [Pseudomonas sp. MRSN 12121]|uniref:hypothetical protein n=1 Tax=Pseudomonas sp. MRSN 12121 TaxID=1611770 RepID=UPI0005BEEB7C|nr:hypothetical protein [Pseudomonas sp. MRSN 12121]AJO79364.1 hypothetical protein TO66_19595 [Pseudomonas sp. MRSN 12121]
MELFHTSPKEITSIDKHGRFGEFLFFSSDVYVMTAGDHVVYRAQIDDDAIIAANHLFYHADAAKLDELVAKFCARFDVDTDTAEEIISERQQLDTGDADDDWDVQIYTARAAKILGYRAVAVSDEQGTAYMVDMLGRESDLSLMQPGSL